MRHIAVVASTSSFESAIRDAAGDVLDIHIVDSSDSAPKGSRIVVLGEPHRVPSSEDVTYVVPRGLSTEDLRCLLTALANGLARSPIVTELRDRADALELEKTLDASSRLALASDLLDGEAIVVESIIDIVDADRSFCLYFDAEDGSLWSESALRGAAGDDRRACAGLVGFAALTGRQLSVERAGTDCRWVEELDDPGGGPHSRLLVQPVVASGVVQAVLVAARDARRPPFDHAQQAVLSRFSDLAAPLLERLSLRAHARAVLNEGKRDSIFLQEAADAQATPLWGDVVRISPSWISYAYWVLLLILAGFLAFLTLSRISTYSSGPAIVRSPARMEVAARLGGNVTRVERLPGDRVSAGAVIVRLDDATQTAAVQRIEREFETRLRNHMLDLQDRDAEAALRGLRLDLEAARAALEDRIVRAPIDGRITDVRARPGQHVAPGDIVASIVDGSTSLEVVALLPGNDRPHLVPGMALRLELSGYRYAYQTVVIESVASDVVASSEARRFLGPEVADNLPLRGPVVIVRASLPNEVFAVDGNAFRYYPGMVGTAEVLVRSERAVNVLFPGLRQLQ